MKKLGGINRRELFERVEREALRPLPSIAYECAEWIERTVNTDYHVEVDKRWYSVPYELAHETVWARFTANTAEILHNNGRVASHVRSRVPYKHTTDPAHMPESHRRHAAGEEGVLAWAATVGPMTVAMVRRLLDANPVREQGWPRREGFNAWVRSTAPCELNSHVSAHRASARARTSQSQTSWRSAARAPACSKTSPKNGSPSCTRTCAARTTTTEERNRMLNEPTIEKLHELRLAVMAEAWQQQQKDAKIGALSIDERFTLLVDAEHQARDNRRLTRLLS
jgi:hypothetical protein